MIKRILNFNHKPDLINNMPIKITTIITNLKKEKFSFKNIVLNNKANKIEVSLNDDTTAIGMYKHAQTTIA